MTTKQRPHRVVSAIVESKAEKQDGFEVALNIPQFKSQYPTTVNQVAEPMAAQLKPGETYNLVLEQQNLRKDKSGDLPWHYYWGLVGLAKAGQEPKAPAQLTQREGRDATGRSIERQVALKAAVEYAGYKIGAGGEITPVQILDAAKRFAHWIASDDAKPAIEQAQQVPPELPQEKGTSPQGGGTPQFKTVTDFWVACEKQGWRKQWVDEALGGNLGTFLNGPPHCTWDDAFAFLTEQAVQGMPPAPPQEEDTPI